MNIIAIESSSTVCGVALFVDNKLIELNELNKPRIHSERLPVVINKLIKEYEINLFDLDGIAVSSGPGSYTGLRIGMSLAKGLAMPVNIPIIPVPTLEVMNHSILNNGSYYVVLYSHKNMVFTQFFKNGLPNSSISCEAFDKNKMQPMYGFNMENVCNISEFEIAPLSAKNVGELAIKNFDKWKVLNLSDITPNYVTKFKLGKV